MVYLKIAVFTGRKSGGQPVSQVRLASVCICVCVEGVWGGGGGGFFFLLFFFSLAIIRYLTLR